MKSLKYASIFVKRLMQRFPSGSPEYEAFLSIMREFYNGDIGSITVAKKMNALFERHKDLIDEFNKFLPGNNVVAADRIPSSKSPLPTPSSSKIRAHSDFSSQRDCIKFLNELRTDLENDDKYREFLEALNQYDSHKDFNRLDQQVSIIFSNCPNFYLNFTKKTVDIHEAMDQNENKTPEEAKIGKRLNFEGEEEETEDIMKQQKKKSRVF